MNQTEKMTKNLILGPILAQICSTNFFAGLPLLVIRHCSKLSSYAIKRKNNAPNFRKQKPNFGPDFCLLDANFDPLLFLAGFNSSI